MSDLENSSEEKVLSAVAYGLNLVLFAAVIGPLIIWLIKKDSSKTVSFHAMQSLLYGAVAIGIHVVFWFIEIIGSLLGPVVCVVSIIHMLMSIALWGYALFLTIKVAMGNDVEIPVIRDWTRNIVGE